MASTKTPYDQQQAAPENVRVGSAWARIREQWWIVLITIVFVTIIGFALASLGGDRSEAEVQVYLGQPLSPSGAQLGIAENQLNTALGLVTSNEFIRTAANEAGIPPRNVAGNVKARQLEAPIAAKVAGTPQVVVIDVNLSNAENAETVARSLAKQLVDETNEYARAKRALLEDQLDVAAATLATQAQAVERARDQIEDASPDSLAVWSMIAQLAQSQADEAALAVEERRTELNLLESIESSRILTEATAEPVQTARPATIIAVSLLIGLIIGGWAAILAGQRRDD